MSGALMLAAVPFTGAHFPKAGELWRTAIYGAMTIGMGTGSLALAEQWIPSGLAALMVCTQPFWMVGVEALMPGGERLHFGAIRGMLVGLAGVAFLVAPAVFASPASPPGTSSHNLLRGFLALQVGAAMWSVGSIAQRRMATRAHPIVSGAVQQFATGVALAIPALLEARTPVWDIKGIAAVTYLAIFGGIIGYSAFIFSMDRLPVALVSIYTYINPIVAVWLGWLFYREAFGWHEAVAMLIIFVGVAMVKRSSRPMKSIPVE
jgi:drug/metabolite transporter (DMT)-like permease